MKNIYLILFIFAVLFIMSSCEKVAEPLSSVDLEYSTGLDTYAEDAIYQSVPKELNLITLGDVEPSDAISLIDYLPPIGDQGTFGTCTSWATGYYTRTITHARENNLSQNDLTNSSNIFSPLDIYLSISHGSNCGGSAISSAFKKMQERGIATLADVPYTNLGDCSQKSYATSAQYSPGKIEHYRRININTEDIKSELQLGRPIAVGCKLGPAFFKYKSGVFQDDDYSEWDAMGKHAGHAMCVIGYDDNKGPNGAFLLVNSWGENWGENGFIWVDYDFFNGGIFCNYAMVIESDKGIAPIIDKNIVDPLNRVDGKDLLAITLQDRNADVWEGNPNPGPRDRTVQYNVFNKGKEIIPASNDWNIVYYYYNAYNPEEDFGIIFYDYYTDDVSNIAQKGDNGNFSDIVSDMTKYGEWNWWNYIDIPSGYSVGRALDGNEADMVFDYQLPSTLNGEYYFVLFADGFNAISEQYEQNNYLFVTGSNKGPITINNGVIEESSLKKAGESRCYINTLKESNPNTYSLDELSKLIDYQKKEGILTTKAVQNHSLKSTHTTGTKRFIRK
nr:C1 family peptidase [uncultured Carboxylicivirga sp.]